MSQFPLQLKQYFFTQIECKANPQYDQAGNAMGSKIDCKFAVNPIDGQEDALGIELTVWVDANTSENPPYSFRVSAFGVLNIAQNTSIEVATQLANVTGMQILVGAVREEIARITSRGPWGAFMLPIILLSPASPQPEE
ncbi:MAG: hypothetical protein WAT12_12510 [Candidatus Nitrotoga sp.]